MIIDGELAPGLLVSEAKFVRLIGVSRTPVREALSRLEAEGYIVSGPGRGYVVVELSDQDVVNIYEVRAVLEGLAASAAAANSMSRANLGHLEDLYEAMEEARRDGNDRDLARLNSQFHHTIAEASGNRYLITMLNGIYDTFERFRPVALRAPGRRDTAAVEHGKLISSLRAGNAEQAKDIAERHVRRALAVRQEAMKKASL